MEAARPTSGMELAPHPTPNKDIHHLLSEWAKTWGPWESLALKWLCMAMTYTTPAWENSAFPSLSWGASPMMR